MVKCQLKYTQKKSECYFNIIIIILSQVSCLLADCLWLTSSFFLLFNIGLGLKCLYRISLHQNNVRAVPCIALQGSNSKRSSNQLF